MPSTECFLVAAVVAQLIPAASNLCEQVSSIFRLIDIFSDHCYYRNSWQILFASPVLLRRST